MDISELDLMTPTEVAEVVTDAHLTAKVVAVFGRAKGLARLAASPHLTHLWISGVNAGAAEVVGRMTHLRRLVVHDLKVGDLRPFGTLSGLEDLSVAGSTKLKSIAGVDALTRLRRLVLFDNGPYPDVDALAALDALETLAVEGGFSKSLVIPSLRPLEGLTNLRRLRLASVKVTDGSLKPLHRLSALREVFIARAFSPEEFAALAVALPEARGAWLDSYRSAR